jgi:hypothetical protein
VAARLGIGMTLTAALASARPATGDESRVSIGAHGVYGSDTNLGVGCDSVVRLSSSPRLAVGFSFDDYLPKGFEYASVAAAFHLGPERPLAMGIRPYVGAGLRVARSAVSGQGVVSRSRPENYAEIHWSLEETRRSKVSSGGVILLGLDLPRQHLYLQARFESGGGEQYVAHVGILF